MQKFVSNPWFFYGIRCAFFGGGGGIMIIASINLSLWLITKAISDRCAILPGLAVGECRL